MRASCVNQLNLRHCARPGLLAEQSKLVNGYSFGNIPIPARDQLPYA